MGFKNQATRTRLRVRKEVPDDRLKYVPERRVWWSVLGMLDRSVVSKADWGVYGDR